MASQAWLHDSPEDDLDDDDIDEEEVDDDDEVERRPMILRRRKKKPEKSSKLFRPLLNEGRKEDPSFLPEQFCNHKHECNFPWSSLALGLFLFTCGAWAFLTLGLDLYEGYDDEREQAELEAQVEGTEELPYTFKKSDRFWPLIMLGFISFTPAVYVLFLILMAFLHAPGYSYEDIP